MTEEKKSAIAEPGERTYQPEKIRKCSEVGKSLTYLRSWKGANVAGVQ